MYTFERAELTGLYTLYTDGRDLVYYNFKKERGIQVDPGLVPGMFSAITSFIQETTKSSDMLRVIDSGEIKVLLEYSKKLEFFVALFADSETSEIRTALRNFLQEFEKTYAKPLSNWNGDMSFFAHALEIVEKHFHEFI